MTLVRLRRRLKLQITRYKPLRIQTVYVSIHDSRMTDFIQQTIQQKLKDVQV
jgi:hypothetical protein